MGLRFSIGSRWFELHFLYPLMLGSWLLLNFEYGHNSTRNLIYLRRDECGALLWKWRRNKARWLNKKGFKR